MSVYVTKRTEFIRGARVSFMEVKTPILFADIKKAMAFCRKYLEDAPWYEGCETQEQIEETNRVKAGVLDEFEEGIASDKDFTIDPFLRFEFVNIDGVIEMNEDGMLEYSEALMDFEFDDLPF